MKKRKRHNEEVIRRYEDLPPQKRTEASIEYSELTMRIAMHVICYTLVYYQDLLKDERLSIAHAFLQRVTTTHLCNHKLTAEGLVYEYKGEPFLLHEDYKTMTLTRSVYEHLAMFYFLFEQPKTDDERDIVWKYWQINSKKNLLDYDAGDDAHVAEEQQNAIQEIEALRSDILSSTLGQQCHHKLNEWTKTECRPSNGSLEFTMTDGKYDVKRLPYSQAWRFLFNNEEMVLFYRHLSMHSHPVYDGLVQYQSQQETDQGNDGITLYYSCRFLASLCRLFLKQLPDGNEIIRQEFTKHELQLFRVLSELGKG
mgnify:CR=1 FL=1